MSEHIDYNLFSTLSLNGELLSENQAKAILESPEIELLPLLQAAFLVRKKSFGRKVRVHILNNIQNGHCPEDCNYCAQAKSAEPKDIAEYPIKSDEEILAEAERAYESGAFRYCMVSAGRGPSNKRVEKLAQLIGQIKTKWPLEVCVSPGLLKKGQAEILKKAGLDRLNHNLNTSEDNYEKICSTHTYKDRLDTLNEARTAGLEVCSGLIVGLGENTKGLIDVLLQLRRLDAKSIPVNFLLDLPGSQIKANGSLSPEYCLRVLCLARLLNPKAEIRAAAGREDHLRSLQPLALYPANSIFVDGYLNVKGDTTLKTYDMIRDAGFEIEMEEGQLSQPPSNEQKTPQLKTRKELHPAL